MTNTKFYKTTSFKCIVVLLSIVLVCGILLTICNSLFYVSDEEKLTRTLSSMYGGTVSYDSITTDDTSTSLTLTNGVVQTTELEKDGTTLEIVIFKINEYNDCLLKVKGTGGFSGGSVTCWVALTMNDDYTAITGVRSVSIDSNVSQSYISKIKSSNLSYFADNYVDSDFDVQLSTGATYSMTAITNAVNSARQFVNAVINEGGVL